MILMMEALHTMMEGTMRAQSLGAHDHDEASLLLHPCSLSSPFWVQH